MSQSSPGRIAGLDILRTTAILLVVFSHSHQLIVPLYFHVPDGVELFFVLSGYLIGTILFETIKQQDALSAYTIRGFLKRRWFRTFPNYFLFLLLHLFLAFGGLSHIAMDIPSALRYVVFLQNFNQPHIPIFWESWSLTVEEWFYLLFPCLLLLFFYVNVWTPKRNILFTILLFLALPLIYRISISLPHNSLNWDVYYRKLVLTRLIQLVLDFLVHILICIILYSGIGYGTVRSLQDVYPSFCCPSFHFNHMTFFIKQFISPYLLSPF